MVLGPIVNMRVALSDCCDVKSSHIDLSPLVARTHGLANKL
jgi:hypothetical protein